MKGLLKSLCGLALAFGLIWADTYDGPAIIWNKTYDSGNDDYATGVAVDGKFVYVTGSSSNGTNWDFQTICYDKDGNLVWNKVYNSYNDDWATGVAVDGEFVYVTGYSSIGTDYDFRTICYDKDGNLIWNKVYDATITDKANGVAVDDNFVYVTGGLGLDFQTICYDKDGNLIWNKTYDSGAKDEANGVAVDDKFVYVTGCWDFRTICYDKDGNLIWNKTYDYPSYSDCANGVAVDEQGYLYVTGFSCILLYWNFRTIKYDRTVGIDELPASGFKLDLKEPAPNPFKLSTDIYYSLAHSGRST